MGPPPLLPGEAARCANLRRTFSGPTSLLSFTCIPHTCQASALSLDPLLADAVKRLCHKCKSLALLRQAGALMRRPSRCAGGQI